jgi:cysteinyl-tRNA synthetase
MAILWEALRSSSLGGKEKRELVEKIEPVLSLNLLESKQKQISPIPEEIQQLANRRQEARVKKNWSRADLLRDEIEKKRFRIIDQDNPDQPYIIETL